MSDLISRQVAIDACESIKRSAIIEDGEPLVRKSAVKYVLDNLPSAEPQKKGKWIEIKYTFKHKCSNCEWINNANSGYNFCPNCGCQMYGGEEE